MSASSSLVLIVALLLGLAQASRAQSIGGLDLTFGAGGKVVLPVPGYSVEGRAVAVDADGRIVVAGTATNATGTPVHRLVVARLHADGTPDTSFAAGGIKVYVPKQAAPEGESFGKGVLVLDDGTILVGGQSGNKFIVSKLSAEGEEDATFDGVGSVLGSTSGVGVSVEVSGMTLDRRFTPNRVMLAGSVTVFGEKDATTQVVTHITDTAKHPWLQEFDLAGTPLPNPVIETVNAGSPAPAGRAITACVSSRDGSAILAGMSSGHRWRMTAGSMSEELPPQLGSNSRTAVQSICTSGDSEFRVTFGGLGGTGTGPRVTRLGQLTGSNFFGPILEADQVDEASEPLGDGDIAIGMLERPDGRLVIATDKGSRGFGVSRLTSRGMLDRTFALYGSSVVQAGFENLISVARTGLGQSGELMLVVGDARGYSSSMASFALARFALGQQTPAAPATPPNITIFGISVIEPGEPVQLNCSSSTGDPVRYQWLIDWSILQDEVLPTLRYPLTSNVTYLGFTVRVSSEAGSYTASFDVLVRNYAWPINLPRVMLWPKGIPWWQPQLDIKDRFGGDGYVQWSGPPTRVSGTSNRYTFSGLTFPYRGFQVPLPLDVEVVKASVDPYAVGPTRKLFAAQSADAVALYDVASSTWTYSTTWQKNGKTLRDASGNATAPVFSNVTLQDAGSYRAIIRNSKGSYTTPSILVGVVDTTNPREVVGAVGKPVSIPAPAAGSGMTYQWRFNGVDLVDSKRIAGAKAKTLTLRSVEAGDVGAYTCRVSNADGSLVSAATTLSLVAGVPTFDSFALPAGSILEPYAFDLSSQLTLGANKFAVSGLPRGMVVDAASGVVSGVPMVEGDFVVRVIASNPAGNAPPLLLPLHINGLPTGAAGRFAGVSSDPERFKVDLNVSGLGVFSASIQLYVGAPLRRSFKGIVRRTGSDLAINFRVKTPTDYLPSEPDFSLQFTGGAWRLNTSIPMHRQVWNSRTYPAAAYQGYYTANFGTGDIDGYAGITVSASGMVTLKCRMIDGLPYVASTFVSEQGDLPVLMWKPGGGGVLVGSPLITPGPSAGSYAAAVTGRMEWSFRKVTAYQLGDEWGGGATEIMTGSRYLPPNVPFVSGPLMFDLPDEPMNFEAWWIDPATGGADSRQGRLTRSHQIAWAPPGDGFSTAKFGGIRFSPKTGLFSGSATLRVSSLISDREYSAPVSFTGMVVRTNPLSPLASGQGFYLRSLAREFNDEYGRLVRRTQRAYGRIYLGGRSQ